MSKQKKKVVVLSEFDQWLELMVREHHESAAEGVWDGSKVSLYYAECRRLYMKQGLRTVMTRNVGGHTSGRFKSAGLDRCFDLSVASFSPVNMMPEAHRQELAVTIVRKMFWPHAGQVWVQKPGIGSGYAGDIWHYLLFVNENWEMRKLTEDERAELVELGFIEFPIVQQSLALNAMMG